MDMVSTFGEMETDTRESGEPVSGMETALTFLPMVINTLDSIVMVIQTALASTNGQTVTPTLVNSSME